MRACVSASVSIGAAGARAIGLLAKGERMERVDSVRWLPGRMGMLLLVSNRGRSAGGTAA